MPRALALLLLALLSLPGQLPAAERALTLTTITWSPYADPGLPGQGIAIEIVQTAFARAGYDTEVVFEETGRGIEGTEIGIYDVAAMLWSSEERARSLAFSEPYLTNEVRLIKRRDKPLRYQGPEDLKGLLVGVTRGYAYGEAFDQAPGVVRVAQNHIVQGLLLLVAGRVDVVVGDKWALLYQLHQFMPHSARDLEMLAEPVTTRGLRIAVARDDPEAERILADFEGALAAMREDGSREAIVERHRRRILDEGLVSPARLEEYRRW